MPTPYRTTPVFDETTLPAALRSEHRTKAGVWGVIRVIKGRVKLVTIDPASEAIITPDHPGLVLPEQPHFVEPLGTMQMRVDFYNEPPGGLPLSPPNPLNPKEQLCRSLSATVRSRS